MRRVFLCSLERLWSAVVSSWSGVNGAGLVFAACFLVDLQNAVGQTLESSIIDKSSVGPAWGLIQGSRTYANWSDLFFSPFVKESVGFNSNVLGAPDNRVLPRGSRGDWFSSTLFGASSEFFVGGQRVYFDGNFGFKKYFANPSYDTSNYFVKSAVDWRLSSACNGELGLLLSKTQQPFQEQVAPGINSVMKYEGFGRSTCTLVGNWNLLLDFDMLAKRSTQKLSAANNLDSITYGGGLEYSVDPLFYIRLLTDVTNRRFINHNPYSLSYSAVSLADESVQIDHKVEMKRAISPNLSIRAMGGVSQLASASSVTGRSLPSLLLPIYYGGLEWQLTPKLEVVASVSRFVGPPSALVSNAQISDTQRLSLDYVHSQKLAFELSVSRSIFAPGRPPVGFLAQELGSTVESLSAQANCAYSLTPFLVATASVQWFGRSSSSYKAHGSVIEFGISYHPH